MSKKTINIAFPNFALFTLNNFKNPKKIIHDKMSETNDIPKTVIRFIFLYLINKTTTFISNILCFLFITTRDFI